MTEIPTKPTFSAEMWAAFGQPRLCRESTTFSLMT